MALARAGAVEGASCRYFRVSVKMTSCRPAPAAASDSRPTEWLDLDGPSDTPMRDITCACGYSLFGSDPRCDFDRAEEYRATRLAPGDRALCARDDRACADLCPRQLP
jgi:hypothetical protein